MGTAGTEGLTLRCNLGLPVGSRAYREQHSWPLARQVALARDEFTCQTCGATDYVAELHVHHVAPCESYEVSCAHHVDGLIVLCVECHREIHRWLRAGCPDTQMALAV